MMEERKLIWGIIRVFRIVMFPFNDKLCDFDIHVFIF